MTTLPPSSDVAVDVLEPATELELVTQLDDSGDGANPPAPPRQGWHPIERFEASGRRFLPGAWFPIVTYVVWRAAHLYMNWRQYVPSYSTLWETALFYDGERYSLILSNGYAGWRQPMPNTAFFPLVSWLTAPLYWITQNKLVAVHLMATITGIGAFITVWGVTKAWKSERLARRTVLLMALFPSSLFLWAFYSEGLFIMLGAGAVWADRRDRRGVAALCLAGLAATRSVGILLAVVLVAARIIRNGRPMPEVRERWWAVLAGSVAGGIVLTWGVLPWLPSSGAIRMAILAGPIVVATVVALVLGRTDGWPAVAGSAAIGAFFVAFGCTGNFALLLPPAAMFGVWALGTRRLDRWCFAYPAAGAVGFAAVCIVMGRQTGDPFAFMKVQEDWGRVLGPFWETIHQGFQNLYPDERTIMIPALVARNFDLWCVPILVFGVAYLAFSRKDRFPMEAWMIGVAFILLPLVSSVLASFNRFVMADWVIYPAYASALERLTFRVRLGWVVAAGSVVFLAVRLSSSANFEIPGWLQAIPPGAFVLAAFGGLAVAVTSKVTMSSRSVAYCSLAVAALWTTWLMVGRFSVDRFVG